MSRHARDVASRLSEFRDLNAQYKETKDPEVLARRNRAMFKDSPETARRASEILQGEIVDAAQAKKDRMKAAGLRVTRRKGD